MADTTISGLTNTNTIDGATVVPADYSGATYKVTANTLGSFITTNAVTVTATGNITGGNLLTGGLISATANVTGGNIRTGGLISATANITGGNLLTGGLISATGNITGAYIVGNGSLLTSIPAGNITGQVANALAAGTVYTNAQPNITSVGSLTSLTVSGNTQSGNLLTGGLVSASGNVTGNYIFGNGACLTGVITSVANINSGTSNVTVVSSGGNISVGVGGTSNVAVFATTGEYVTGIVSASGNIISSGNVSGGNLSTGGQISASGNINTSGYFVGNFAGNISGNLTVPGSNTQVLFNSNGNAGAASGLTFASDTNLLSVTGNVLANNGMFTNVVNVASHTGAVVSVTGNVTANNGMFTNVVNVASFTGGLVSVTGNVTANNGIFTNIVNVASFTGAVVSVSGNVTGGNILTGGLISSTSTITGTSFLGAVVSTTGNITGGNVTLDTGTGNLYAHDASFGGVVSATGNISGSYILGNGALLSGVITSVANINLGNSNVTVVSSGGNVAVGVGGTSNVTVFATSGAYVTGIVSASGNITGGNIVTSGAGGAISGSGNITAGNFLTGGLISATGAITINSGNAATAIINGAGNAVGNIGSSSKYFNQVFAQATTALYADLAEVYSADAEYAPGTVVSFGGDQEVTKSITPSDPRVAGVISEKPSYLMNSGLDAEHRAAVALTGRVPTLVIGPVRKGDMMVSAGNGWAQACTTPAMGTVIGKALVNFNGDSGIIEIVVGRM